MCASVVGMNGNATYQRLESHSMEVRTSSGAHQRREGRGDGGSPGCSHRQTIRARALWGLQCATRWLCLPMYCSFAVVLVEVLLRLEDGTGLCGLRGNPA